MKRNNPETSKEAFRSLTAKELSDTHKSIVSALSVLGEATTEEVAAYLREPHAKIWKRFSELAKNEVIHRPGHKRLLKSGRNGYTWMLSTEHTPKTTAQENVFKNGQKSSTDYAKSLNLLTKPLTLFPNENA